MRQHSPPPTRAIRNRSQPAHHFRRSPVGRSNSNGPSLKSAPSHRIPGTSHTPPTVDPFGTASRTGDARLLSPPAPPATLRCSCSPLNLHRSSHGSKVHAHRHHAASTRVMQARSIRARSPSPGSRPSQRQAPLRSPHDLRTSESAPRPYRPDRAFVGARPRTHRTSSHQAYRDPCCTVSGEQPPVTGLMLIRTLSSHVRQVALAPTMP